jgi:CMP-N,N'-diacetyllegionaminic acid synthase
MSVLPVLAVIPARGGSKGLPGKNVRSFLGLPLIAHSIRCARTCRQVARCLVSTDSAEIAQCARANGADVPFLRPANLAQDDTPMMPVLQHALTEAERTEGRRYGSLLLLDPTSPGRIPSDIERAVDLLEEDSECVGVVGVSEPHFNPRWVCVEEKGGYMNLAFADGAKFVRRQDVSPVYRINATLYLWRRDYLLSAPSAPFSTSNRHKMLVVPETRAMHIDTLEDFQLAEATVRSGIVKLPWLDDLK